MILFLVAALAPKSFAGDALVASSDSVSYVKHSATPVANNCQLPFEEKEEEKNQDSITNFPILISYILATLNNAGPDKLQVCEFGHQALTGNTPLYLSKRTLLI
jgi:hypothetical protein